MLAPVRLPARYAEWNQRWGAPYGFETQRFIPYRWRLSRWASRYVGVFAFQPNNCSRQWEYPWAWDMGEIRAGLRCVDIGGGHSGFSFVLSRAGAESWVVDPFLDYGGSHHYVGEPVEMITRMNRAFSTNVQVFHGTVENLPLAPNSVDRIFCLSALEHMPPSARQHIASAAARLLRAGGRFVVTIDLFLNLVPFTSRGENQFGTNIDVRAFVEATGLRSIVGEPAELMGYSAFDADAVQSRLERYALSVPYPVLTQCVVLERPTAAGRAEVIS
jgi:SAM-dependent methyltransferase